MVNIFLIFILSIQLFSANIEALKREKMEYKEHQSIKYKKKGFV